MLYTKNKNKKGKYMHIFIRFFSMKAGILTNFYTSISIWSFLSNLQPLQGY